MRRWLIQKKQSIAEKLEFADDKESAESEALREVISKVVKKAEFLSVLHASVAAFKDNNQAAGGTKDSQASIERRPSMMMRQVSQQQAEEIVFDLKQQMSNERSKQILEAGTTSVLACLQTPIQVHQIINHVALSTRRAIRRLSAF